MSGQSTFSPVEALEVIRGLAEGSTTANTLPHIAKIAASALSGYEAWLRGPTRAEVEEAKRKNEDMREACRQVAARYVVASGADGNPNEWNLGWKAAAEAIEHEIRAGDPLRNATP